MILNDIPRYIAGAAGLGTAAFALVDASKAVGGGVSNCGFKYIRRAVEKFFPAGTTAGPMGLDDVLATLRANWLNGTPFGDQTAIARSLIKLRLDPERAPALARVTGVDAKALGAVATKIAGGKPLTTAESDVHGRFNLLLTAILDEGYQRADQSYRNSAKAWSAVAAVALAVFGIFMVEPSVGADQLMEAIVVGLVATPLAPVAKDLTSALQAAANVGQMLKK